jgi:hypothetical protein
METFVLKIPLHPPSSPFSKGGVYGIFMRIKSSGNPGIHIPELSVKGFTGFPFTRESTRVLGPQRRMTESAGMIFT